jgi:DNA-3-methyladenine glycosylase II
MHLTHETLADGIAHLCQADPDFARVVRDHGVPAMREGAPGFATLLRSIVGQQLSVLAARSIWNKLIAALDPLCPETMLAASDETLRAAGLSGQKMRYGRALALAVAERTVDLDAIQAMTDEDAIAELIKAPGIGRWTAEIYLMFALRRPDILPSADLGLIVAAQALKGLPARPKPGEMIALGETWRPWRSVASLLLWHYRHNMPDWSKSA